MKTLKFFAVMLFVMLQYQNSFPYGVTMSYPCINAAYPSPYFYPDGNVSVNYRVNKEFEYESNYPVCRIYVKQRNVSMMMYEHQVNVNVNLSTPINLMNFPNLAYNEPAEIKIVIINLAVPIPYTVYGYVIFYKEGMSTTYGSISNGTPQLINSGFATFYNSQDCNSLATGNYYINQYKITFTLDGNFTDSIPVLDVGYSQGWSGGIPNYQTKWAAIISQTSTEVKFILFVYFVTNTAGQQLGFRPCPPSLATIVYHYERKPVISRIEQLVCPLTPNNHIGLFFCSMLQGNNLHYQWRDSFNIHDHQLIQLADTIPYVILNANLSNINERVPPYELRVRAYNNWGYSEWKDLRVSFSNDPPHGCPNIEASAFGNNFFVNPILTRSPGNPGKEVTDYFILSSGFFEMNDSIIFSIKESDDDITQINMLQMYQALVPDGNEFGVTPEGEPVTFKITPGKNKVLLNSNEDKTEELNLADDEGVELSIDDELNIVFPDDNVSQYIVLRMRTNDKTLPAAMIKTSNGYESKEVYSRTNMSTTVLKVKPGNFSWVNLTALQKSEVDFIAIVANEDSLKIKKLNLISAVNNEGDASKGIFSIDKYYAIVQKDNPLKLIFQNNKTTDMKSCYYTSITGSYTGDSNVDNSILKNDTENKMEFKLFDNIPNPFNPVTNIKFQIPDAGFVKLTVYDISGREIKTLINEFKAEGNYEFNFDGRSFASGVYFYKLESGIFTDTKRMFLIK